MTPRGAAPQGATNVPTGRASRAAFMATLQTKAPLADRTRQRLFRSKDSHRYRQPSPRRFEACLRHRVAKRPRRQRPQPKPTAQALWEERTPKRARRGPAATARWGSCVAPSKRSSGRSTFSAPVRRRQAQPPWAATRTATWTLRRGQAGCGVALTRQRPGRPRHRRSQSRKTASPPPMSRTCSTTTRCCHHHCPCRTLDQREAQIWPLRCCRPGPSGTGTRRMPRRHWCRRPRRMRRCSRRERRIR
jgi:hypothetical protein